MKKFIVYAFALTLVLISCEKDPSEPVYEDYQSSTLLRQVGNSDFDMQILTYYNTGKIFENLGRFYYRKYLYNSKQQLEKVEIVLTINPLSCAIIPGTSLEDGGDPRKAPVSQYEEFYYNNEGKLIRKEYFYINDDITTLFNYDILKYEGDNITKIETYSIQDVLLSYSKFNYTENGNVSSEEIYFVNNELEETLQTRIEYQYDDKKNPFKVMAVEGSPGVSTNTNNITRQTNINYYEGTEDVYTITNTYEYNELGYPVKVNDIAYVYGKDE